MGIVYIENKRKMKKKYINIHRNVEIHWWGKELYFFVNRDSYIACSKTDWIILPIMEKGLNIEETSILIAKNMRISIKHALQIIECFMEEYDKYFYYDEKKASIARISGEKNSYYPIELHISLTNRCPQSCFHCYKEATQIGTDIDYEQLVSFLNREKGKVRQIYLSGGEPTLHPDFVNILQELNGKYKVSVLTSGIEIGRFLPQIKRVDANIVFTIFSSRAEVHDMMAGKNNSYNEIMKNVASAKEMGINVTITTFLQRDNYKDIINLVSILNEMNVDMINVARISKMGRAKNVKQFDKLEVKNFEIEQFKKATIEMDNVLFSEEKQELQNGYNLPLSVFPCSAGNIVWSINETGGVYPCGFQSKAEYQIGTITDINVFSGKRRREYIKELRKKQLYISEAKSCPLVE